MNKSKPPARSVGALAAVAALAHGDANNVFRKLRVAEQKVQNVELLCAAWRVQCEQQPPDSPARVIAESLIGGIEAVLAKATPL